MAHQFKIYCDAKKYRREEKANETFGKGTISNIPFFTHKVS
jgi:hypothetical protein